MVKKVKDVVNLTPHLVNLRDEEDNEFVVTPSGLLARAREVRKVVGEVELPGGMRVPILQVEYGDLTLVDKEGKEMPFPSEREDTIYIVSSLAAQAAKRTMPERQDLFVPGDPIRDEQGRIIGAKGLCKI